MKTFAHNVPWQAPNNVFGSTVLTEIRPGLRAWTVSPLLHNSNRLTPEINLPSVVHFYMVHAQPAITFLPPFVTIPYWENILRVAWLVVADVSEIHSLQLQFLHCVLTSGNVMGGNISEKYFASMFRVCFLFCVYSSSVALQPNLGLGLLNPPSPNITILCRPYPVLALQHPLINSAHCIIPPSSGPSNWSALSYLSFRCYLGTPSTFIPIT